MGRKRKTNKHLPRRWTIHHGAYYFMVPPGAEEHWDGKKKFRLGKTELEAYKTWAARIDREQTDIRTVGRLLERYLLEHVPTLSPSTQRGYRAQIKPLKLFFGEMSLADVEPHHVYEFIDARSKASPRGAGQAVKILQHAYKKARQWGAGNLPNPCQGIRVKKGKRTRYVEDWELQCVYNVCNPTLRAFINIAVMTGLRKKDILELKLMDVRHPQGIRLTTSKTAENKIIFWTEELRAAVAQAEALRRPRTWANGKTVTPVQSIYLFSTRNGDCYMNEDEESSGFDSMWQRAVKKALEETELKAPFTMHDLRAKCASDIEEGHAQRLLGHKSAAQTAEYRRKPRGVMPHAGSKLT